MYEIKQMSYDTEDAWRQAGKIAGSHAEQVRLAALLAAAKERKNKIECLGTAGVTNAERTLADGIREYSDRIQFKSDTQKGKFSTLTWNQQDIDYICKMIKKFPHPDMIHPAGYLSACHLKLFYGESKFDWRNIQFRIVGDEDADVDRCQILKYYLWLSQQKSDT